MNSSCPPVYFPPFPLTWLHIGVSGNPIDPHTRLAVIMRFLAGGQLADLVDIYVG